MARLTEMDMILALGIIASIICPCVSINCFMRADGVYEQNCRAFTKCVSSETVVVNCQYGEAYDVTKQICADKWLVPPPCGTFRDCQDVNDGFYADYETKCSSYYTCSNGLFFGHTLCPGDLVYNAAQQVCDFRFNVPPPCGTSVTVPIVDASTSTVATETENTPSS